MWWLPRSPVPPGSPSSALIATSLGLELACGLSFLRSVWFAAQELEDDLASVEASVGDLIGADKAEVMARPMWNFGESLITEADLDKMVEGGYFSAGWAEVPPLGQSGPAPKAGYAVVFRDLFESGLRMPAYDFLRQVLEAFNL